MVVSTKFTHADLLVMPDDGRRREIINGDLFVTPSPLSDHQRVVSRIASAFFLYLRDRLIGELFTAPLDVVLGEYDVFEPDLLFILNEHRGIIRDWVRGAPDLVVEVLSPTTASHDRGPKLKTYARYGVAEYWIADPEQKVIEVYRAAPEGYKQVRIFDMQEALTSPLLPGFVLPVKDIFSDQPESRS